MAVVAVSATGNAVVVSFFQDEAAGQEEIATDDKQSIVFAAVAAVYSCCSRCRLLRLLIKGDGVSAGRDAVIFSLLILRRLIVGGTM